MSSSASTGNHTPGGNHSPTKKSHSPGRKDQPKSTGNTVTTSPQKKAPIKKSKSHPVRPIKPTKPSSTPAQSGTVTPASTGGGGGGLPINKSSRRPSVLQPLPRLENRPKKTEQQFSEEREVIRALKEDLYPTSRRINELDTLNETDNEDI